MIDIELITSNLDGKLIAYSNHTIFLVQTGKGRGSYTKSIPFKGSLIQAVSYYNSVNIGNHHKKRLMMNGKVLARAQS